MSRTSRLAKAYSAPTKAFRAFTREWRRNYRHHGGATAFGRCSLGTAAVKTGLIRPSGTGATVEILTFSVVPWMTAVWAKLLRQSIPSHVADLLIGDCSGGLREAQREWIGRDHTRFVPCLNSHHGDKLDLFLARLCRAPYVLIADDDVFWFDDEPLRWALEQLKADPKVAAVSLKPRDHLSDAMRHDGITRPMGSHCLVIRTEAWRREKLSFAVAPPPPGIDDFIYDTGDLANRDLLQRGYRVVIAPPELESSFVEFDALSSWILRLQGQSPDQLARAVVDIPIRRRKVLQTLAFARELTVLLGELGFAGSPPEVVPEAKLDAADRALEARLPALEREAERATVEQRLRLIRDRLVAQRPEE